MQSEESEKSQLARLKKLNRLQIQIAHMLEIQRIT